MEYIVAKFSNFLARVVIVMAYTMPLIILTRWYGYQSGLSLTNFGAAVPALVMAILNLSFGWALADVHVRYRRWAMAKRDLELAVSLVMGWALQAGIFVAATVLMYENTWATFIAGIVIFLLNTGTPGLIYYMFYCTWSEESKDYYSPATIADRALQTAA